MSYFTVHRDHRDRIQKEFGDSAGTTLLVWIALCDIANTEGPEFESRQSALAHLAVVSVRTLQRALENLESIHFLTRTQRKNEDGGTGEYVYTLPPLRHKVVSPTPQSRTPYDITPTTACRPLIIGKTDKKGEDPLCRNGGSPFSQSQRISLEKAQHALKEQIPSLIDDLKYADRPEEQERIHEGITKAKSRLAEIEAELGGSRG